LWLAPGALLDCVEDATRDEDVAAGAYHQRAVDAALEAWEGCLRLSSELGSIVAPLVEPEGQGVVGEAVAAGERKLPPRLGRLDPITCRSASQTASASAAISTECSST
jgi:hypothetical protein